jgi:hypothetical protein
MAIWVRTYFEDTTIYWEIGEDEWVSRSVELVGADCRPSAATALEEVIRARDSGGIEAVQAYEMRYGVSPEKPIEDRDFPHENITEAEFEQVWRDARRALR